MYDGSKVIIGKHHFRRLLGHLGTLYPHRHAHVGALERRRIIDAVAGHGNDLAAGLQRLYQLQLLLG
mgnify:CR=1 FL=1